MALEGSSRAVRERISMCRHVAPHGKEVCTNLGNTACRAKLCHVPGLSASIQDRQLPVRQAAASCAGMRSSQSTGPTEFLVRWCVDGMHKMKETQTHRQGKGNCADTAGTTRRHRGGPQARWRREESPSRLELVRPDSRSPLAAGIQFVVCVPRIRQKFTFRLAAHIPCWDVFPFLKPVRSLSGELCISSSRANFDHGLQGLGFRV